MKFGKIRGYRVIADIDFGDGQTREVPLGVGHSLVLDDGGSPLIDAALPESATLPEVVDGPFLIAYGVPAKPLSKDDKARLRKKLPNVQFPTTMPGWRIDRAVAEFVPSAENSDDAVEFVLDDQPVDEWLVLLTNQDYHVYAFTVRRPPEGSDDPLLVIQPWGRVNPWEHEWPAFGVFKHPDATASATKPTVEKPTPTTKAPPKTAKKTAKAKATTTTAVTTTTAKTEVAKTAETANDVREKGKEAEEAKQETAKGAPAPSDDEMTHRMLENPARLQKLVWDLRERDGRDACVAPFAEGDYKVYQYKSRGKKTSMFALLWEQPGLKKARKLRTSGDKSGLLAGATEDAKRRLEASQGDRAARASVMRILDEWAQGPELLSLADTRYRYKPGRSRREESTAVLYYLNGDDTVTLRATSKSGSIDVRVHVYKDGKLHAEGDVKVPRNGAAQFPTMLDKVVSTVEHVTLEWTHTKAGVYEAHYRGRRLVVSRSRSDGSWGLVMDGDHVDCADSSGALKDAAPRIVEAELASRAKPKPPKQEPPKQEPASKPTSPPEPEPKARAEVTELLDGMSTAQKKALRRLVIIVSSEESPKIGARTLGVLYKKELAGTIDNKPRATALGIEVAEAMGATTRKSITKAARKAAAASPLTGKAAAAGPATPATKQEPAPKTTPAPTLAADEWFAADKKAWPHVNTTLDIHLRQQPSADLLDIRIDLFEAFRKDTRRGLVIAKGDMVWLPDAAVFEGKVLFDSDLGPQYAKVALAKEQEELKVDGETTPRQLYTHDGSLRDGTYVFLHRAYYKRGDTDYRNKPLDYILEGWQQVHRILRTLEKSGMRETLERREPEPATEEPAPALSDAEAAKVLGAEVEKQLKQLISQLGIEPDEESAA
ncbi:MAG: hypothetical protein H6721_00030 [Sandaracinus sp.]|nr:hypothetical protein [Sandaracinus sp.]